MFFKSDEIQFEVDMFEVLTFFLMFSTTLNSFPLPSLDVSLGSSIEKIGNVFYCNFEKGKEQDRRKRFTIIGCNILNLK